ncbi:steroid receptor RNA activator 1-like [Malaya genurostris]|uniref:steroid receptor RNA activator 1-like n=1 Tax=Malaya genurostris TaxID=325434 RepID=UPI0026F3FC1B|nr:steroid receptor RNA activator 1-like [Malaya genurostris]
MSGENYRSATKSHDPGWNDPPKIDYNSTEGSPKQTKLNLNKRVAFPVLNATNPQVPVGSLLPHFVPPSASEHPNVHSIPATQPCVLTTPPKSVPNQSQKITSVQDTSIYPDSSDMLKDFQEALDQLVLELDSSKQAEIRKRCALIERSWSDGKLCESLTRKLYRLAQALTDRKATEANEIHRSIVVDHGSDCVQWAPALRQLVLTVAKEKVTEDSKTKSIVEPLSGA